MMHYKKSLGVILVICSIICLCGCGHAFRSEPLESLQEQGYVTKIVEEEITIGGLSKPYKLIAVADMHAIINNGEVKPEEQETVEQRIAVFSNRNGYTAEEQFEALMREIDAANADAILFAGDILDFYSIANAQLVERCLEQLETPYIFTGADHDYQDYYSNVSEEHMEEVDRRIMEEPVSVIEFDDLILLGWNNNTSQATPDGVAMIEAELSKGKPVIMIAHVPFQSKLDPSLDEATRAAWEGRSLLWGNDDEAYLADEQTSKLLDLVYEESSPVKAVVTGHMHFPWRGKLTENTEQIVLAPSFEGVVTVFEIK